MSVIVKTFVAFCAALCAVILAPSAHAFDFFGVLINLAVLGHFVGLGHYHSDPSAMMGYWQLVNVIALGSDDIAGVLSLYPPSGSEHLKTLAPCRSVVAPMSLGQRLRRGRQLNFLAYVFLNALRRHCAVSGFQDMVMPPSTAKVCPVM